MDIGTLNLKIEAKLDTVRNYPAINNQLSYDRTQDETGYYSSLLQSVYSEIKIIHETISTLGLTPEYKLNYSLSDIKKILNDNFDRVTCNLTAGQMGYC